MTPALPVDRGGRAATKCAAALLVALSLRTEAATAATGSEPVAPERRLALTTSLLTPFFGAYLLEGTARSSDSFGLLANTSYLTLENPKDDAWKTHAGTVGAGLDWYLPPAVLRRVYLEAIGELVFSSWHYRPTQQVAPLALGYTALAVLGYRYIFAGGLVLDGGAGAVAIHFPSARVALESGGSASSKAFTNFYPAVKLNIGWAF
jgi:hypothetical protein